VNPAMERLSHKDRGRITLGPVLFNWPEEKWRDFYFRVADEAPVDSVTLGEVVCAKRIPLTAPHLAEVTERLERAGKEVVFATLALVMSERDLDAVRAVTLGAAEGLLVEANDVSTLGLLAGAAHVAGPGLNVYNEDTLAWLAGNGAIRVCLPGEMPGASITELGRAAPVDLEVQVFGRMPLAISARCYHARECGLDRDSCQFVCERDTDGMEVRTLDGAPFVAVNGMQTLSHACCNLAGEVPDLRTAGVSHFRLSPQDMDMVAVAGVFRDLLDGQIEPAAAISNLTAIVDGMPFANGFFYGDEGHAAMGALAE